MRVVWLERPGGPQALAVVERPRPEPGRGEVRVRAQALGVGKPDMLMRRGIYKWMPPLPTVVGNELAGVIDAVGEGVRGVREGDRVLVSSRELAQRGGCHAEAVCVPAAAVFALPGGVSAEDAVSAPNYQMAAAMLFDAGGARPRSVLVHGAAGGVATAVLQLAQAHDVLAIGTASTAAKAAHARGAGALHVIDRSCTDVHAAVMEQTAGRGVDLVLDHVGGPGFVANLDLLAPRGTLLSFNVLAGVPQDNLVEALRARLDRSLAVRCYSIHTLDDDAPRRRELMQDVLRLMGEGRLRPPPAVRFALDDVRAAHELLDAGSSPGKIVLVP
ncbi:MAG: zinc-binding dehydrogenase [Burkholderiales bacterium]|nr:zinc-binding dehydrogenase [Burkholderiales bacterium]